MGDVHYPSVRLGKIPPGEKTTYVKECVAGIDIYYRERLADMFRTVTIKVEKLLFIKLLVASGEK